MNISEFLKDIYVLFVDMSFYLVIGLFFAGILHVCFSREWVTKHVGQNNTASVVKASLLGVPLPLCSCGVIPTAVFLRRNGASTGAVASFLISTPQTGIDSIIATYGMMGLPLAVYRPIAAFLSGIIGGLFINKAAKNNPNEFNADFSIAESCCSAEKDSSCSAAGHSECSCSCGHDHGPSSETPKTFADKIKRIFSYAFVDMLDDISLHLTMGIVIAALINQLVPDDFFIRYGLTGGLKAMVLMVIIGLPMYICSTSSIPIAISLMMKGFTPGAAFVFLFAGPVTNAASVAVLTKTLGKKVTALYMTAVTVMAIAFGYLFDLISGGEYYLYNTAGHISHGTSSEILKLVVASFFLILLVRSFIARFYKKYANSHNNNNFHFF